MSQEEVGKNRVRSLDKSLVLFALIFQKVKEDTKTRKKRMCLTLKWIVK